MQSMVKKAITVRLEEELVASLGENKTGRIEDLIRSSLGYCPTCHQAVGGGGTLHELTPAQVEDVKGRESHADRLATARAPHSERLAKARAAQESVGEKRATHPFVSESLDADLPPKPLPLDTSECDTRCTGNRFGPQHKRACKLWRKA
jgi:hypothetical protein